jgi:hypothetical protein
MEKDESKHVAPGAREEVLQIAPRIYREYVNEFRDLARASESEPQRAIYLKAAEMWFDAAMRFETGQFDSGREQQKPAA